MNLIKVGQRIINLDKITDTVMCEGNVLLVYFDKIGIGVYLTGQEALDLRAYLETMAADVAGSAGESK